MVKLDAFSGLWDWIMNDAVPFLDFLGEKIFGFVRKILSAEFVSSPNFIFVVLGLILVVCGFSLRKIAKSVLLVIIGFALAALAVAEFGIDLSSLGASLKGLFGGSAS